MDAEEKQDGGVTHVRGSNELTKQPLQLNEGFENGRHGSSSRKGAKHRETIKHRNHFHHPKGKIPWRKPTKRGKKLTGGNSRGAGVGGVPQVKRRGVCVTQVSGVEDVLNHDRLQNAVRPVEGVDRVEPRRIGEDLVVTGRRVGVGLLLPLVEEPVLRRRRVNKGLRGEGAG